MNDSRRMTGAVGKAGRTLQQRKQDLVRDELRTAAIDLFVKKGFEATTVDAITEAAGVSRRTFFRYYAAKESVLVEESDRLADDLIEAVSRRPSDEPPLVATRKALIPVIERHLQKPALVRHLMGLIRGSLTLRRALQERHNRMEERLARLWAERLGVDQESDSAPALIAFLTRALLDTTFNVWMDQHVEDIAPVIEELFAKLHTLASQ
jgi:AcrR family transcriptional regulator